MRLATVIVVLAAIAVTLVHLRRREITVRHEIQLLRTRQVALRRKLWDQQVRLGQLTAPRRIRHFAEEMALGRRASDPTAMRD